MRFSAAVVWAHRGAAVKDEPVRLRVDGILHLSSAPWGGFCKNGVTLLCRWNGVCASSLPCLPPGQLRAPRHPVTASCAGCKYRILLKTPVKGSFMFIYLTNCFGLKTGFGRERVHVMI